MSMPKQNQWSENPYPGDTVKADHGSSISFLKKIVTGTNKDVLLGLFMALALIEGAALWMQWHHKEQESDLGMSQLHDFQTLTINPLAAQVKSDHDLIQAYGLRNSLADCKR